MRFVFGALVAGFVVLGCGKDGKSPAGPGDAGGGASSGGSSGSGGTDAGSGGSAATSGGDAAPCVVDTSYNPTIDPTKFKTKVDNPLFPLVPGQKRVYRAGPTGTERVEITVESTTKQILGITTTVLHDVHTVAGEPIEDTIDWYAQDVDGNVWYMGENTKELAGGKVTSTHGTWTAGVDGAKPGIVVQAKPKVGQKYRQEYYACEAEDFGEVLALAESVTVPSGTYTGCLRTHDYTPLEPAINEEKYYCPGIGNVLSVDVATNEREELLMEP